VGILRLPEGLGTPTKLPFFQVFTAGGTIAQRTWSFAEDPQPGPGGFAGFQAVSFLADDGEITRVAFSSSAPGDAPSNLVLFDNLTFLTTEPGHGGGGPEPIPGPISTSLFGAGLLGLAALRRRRQG
jgi:hypothetical protein